MKIDWKHIDIKDLAALVSERLRVKGIDAILVGGACVSVYTKNKYLSSDLDFASYATVKEISPVLAEFGFERKSSRHFVRKDCPFFIEFVAPPPSIGNELITVKARIKTRFGSVTLLTPTDCVKDRLAAFYHWNDHQALEQAVMVTHAKKVSLKEIKRWSEQEGHKEKYKVFLSVRKKK